MLDTERKVALLSPEDRARMQRLSEEIQGRIKEMALIFARTMKMHFDESYSLKFQPEKPADVAFVAAGGQHIQIVCAGIDGPCGCYVDPPGECVYTGNPNGC